jgi:hypothetical protein
LSHIHRPVQAIHRAEMMQATKNSSAPDETATPGIKQCCQLMLGNINEYVK